MLSVERHRQRASKLVASRGREVKLVKRSRDDGSTYFGSGHDADPEDTAEATALFWDRRFSQQPQEQRDKRITVTIAAKGLGVDPTTFDELHDGERVYEIQEGSPAQPGDRPILYELTVTAKR